MKKSSSKNAAAAKRTSAKKPAAAKPSAVADWTILVYLAGDNDLDSFGGKDLVEMKKVGSSDRINVIVQRDSADDGGARRYRVRKGTTLAQDEVAELGKTNTGDPKVLTDFLNWGLTKYPAKRTMAVLWNHGSGWDDTDIYAEAKRRGLNPVPAPTPVAGLRRGGGGLRGSLPQGFAVKRSVKKVKRRRGPFFITAFQMKEEDGLRRAIAFDDDAQDFLDSVEMKKVFASVSKKAKRKFDLIGMDACLMSMVETGLQVQTSGQFFCGSQEIEPGDGWPYDRILKLLAAKPGMDGKALAATIVKEYIRSYAKDEPVTQSAFTLDSLTAVQKAADALGTLLAGALAKAQDLTLEGALSLARKRSQKYEHPDYVDLADFSTHIAALWPKAAKAAAAVKQAIRKCVFANEAPHANVKRSNGLSIYLPVDEVSELYKNLDFAKGGWAKFLAARDA
jgi:hypothetical protein